MIKLYGVPSCTKIRNTKEIFDLQDITYEFINVKKTPISREKLLEIIDQVGIENLFNKKGTTYRKLQIDFDSLSDKQRIDWLLNEQSMIKRPLLEKDGKYHVGWDESAIVSFVKR